MYSDREILDRIIVKYEFDPARCNVRVSSMSGDIEVIQHSLKMPPAVNELYWKYTSLLGDEFRNVLIKESQPDLYRFIKETVGAIEADYGDRMITIKESEFLAEKDRAAAYKDSAVSKWFVPLHQQKDKFYL